MYSRRSPRQHVWWHLVRVSAILGMNDILALVCQLETRALSLSANSITSKAVVPNW
ncbi:hypothetical protein IF2G_00899 [Cordyceps javanica]|nr:hypothetical protein IF2G_00899 [Cordyceps javanica]